MRLIDADNLMELYADPKDFSIAMCNVPIPIIRQNIKDMPTIDAVEVVRCKDCQFAINGIHGLMCYRFEEYTFDSSFCSYGERKKDEKKTCGSCSNFLGCGDWNLCCKIRAGLCYEDTPACEEHERKDGDGNES